MAGCIELSPGTVLCNTGISMSKEVSLEGVGWGSVLQAGAAMGALLTVPSHNATVRPTVQGGKITNLYLNGADLANRCLLVNNAVKWDFQFLRAYNALDAALVLANTQNCSFLTCDIGTSGTLATYPSGGALRLNGPASGNLFLCCEISTGESHNIVFTNDNTLDTFEAGWGTTFGPQNNSFDTCMIEYLTDGSTSNILINAGRWNTFRETSFSIPVTVGPVIMIHLDNSAASKQIYQNGFRRCEFTMLGAAAGTGKVVTFLKNTSAAPFTGGGYATLIQGCYIGHCNTDFDMDSTVDAVWLDAHNIIAAALEGGVTPTFYAGAIAQNSSVNAGTVKGVLVQGRQMLGEQGMYLVGLPDINHNELRLRTAQTIASATTAGDAGTQAWDTNYRYQCTANATWKRMVYPSAWGAAPMERLEGWVADGVSAQILSLGLLPAFAVVTNVRIQVTEAFNSDGTDEIEVGYANSPGTVLNAFATLTDVSTTGIKTVTLGADAGFNAVARDTYAWYINGGSEPTTGKALVTLEFYLAEAEVA